MKHLILCYLILLCKTCGAENLTFSSFGKKTNAFSIEKLQKQLPPTTIKVLEPHDNSYVEYVGWDFSKLLDLVYSKNQRTQAEEILFTCLDGYQPALSISTFTKYRAFLAYKRQDGKDFKINNLKQNQLVSLGPFYLVWDNIKHKEVQEGHYWPYQVKSIDLIRFKDRFPKISPPDKSSEQVKSGFVLYRTHCMSCHTMNGEGGKKAPELNYPMNVTEYFDSQFLKKWISNPTSVRYNTTMPALADPSKENLSALIAYLKAMKTKKIKPSES